MFHQLLVAWFDFVQQWGYLGIAVLMAMESSIFPVPSEVVVPPAAFWAAQGRLDFWGVIAAATLGSYLGSILTYGAAQGLGLPLVRRYGRWFLLSEEKLQLAEGWVRQYGVGGIFFARLLPVVRHLISIPAGLFRMPVAPFSGATLLGALIWCTVLAYFGRDVIGSAPELLQSPEAMVMAIKGKLHHLILGIVLLASAYGLVLWKKIQMSRVPSKSTSTM